MFDTSCSFCKDFTLLIRDVLTFLIVRTSIPLTRSVCLCVLRFVRVTGFEPVPPALSQVCCRYTKPILRSIVPWLLTLHGFLLSIVQRHLLTLCRCFRNYIFSIIFCSSIHPRRIYITTAKIFCQTMAIWTKNFEIFFGIVKAIAIFMVYLQNR